MENGTGGITWDALPLAIDFYEVENVEGLIERLLVIKGHRPPKEELPPS